MKKNVMIMGTIIMILCNVSNVLAEENRSMRDVLMSVDKWYYVCEDSTTYLGEFYTESGIGVFVFNKGELIVSDRCVPYYLSNEADSTFDESKVGKNKNGKYLIKRTLGTKIVYVYEVLKLDSDSLIMADTKERGRILKYVSKKL